MNLAKLDRLKEKLCNEKDFSKIFEYFMDYFGENEKFMRKSQPTRHDLLENTMTSVLRNLLGERAGISQFMLLAAPGTPFIHGGCLTGGKMANVLYFDDIQTGVIGIFSFPPGGMTQYSRFRLQQLPPEAVPSEN
jgi:hypothetical protein